MARRRSVRLRVYASLFAGTCALLAASGLAQTTDTSADVPPVMRAALFSDAAAVEELLKQGADPNQTDSVGATALMWAVPDIEKSRRLLERGANVNARSTNLGRTPFLIAAGYPGSVDVLALLLERGADVRAKDTAGFYRRLQTRWCLPILTGTFPGRTRPGPEGGGHRFSRCVRARAGTA